MAVSKKRSQTKATKGVKKRTSLRKSAAKKASSTKEKAGKKSPKKKSRTKKILPKKTKTKDSAKKTKAKKTPARKAKPKASKKILAKKTKTKAPAKKTKAKKTPARKAKPRASKKTLAKKTKAKKTPTRKAKPKQKVPAPESVAQETTKHSQDLGFTRSEPLMSTPSEERKRRNIPELETLPPPALVGRRPVERELAIQAIRAAFSEGAQEQQETLDFQLPSLDDAPSPLENADDRTTDAFRSDLKSRLPGE